MYSTSELNKEVVVDLVNTIEEHTSRKIFGSKLIEALAMLALTDRKIFLRLIEDERIFKDYKKSKKYIRERRQSSYDCLHKFVEESENDG